MKILALESSSTMASVAVIENKCLLGNFYINTKLTHSETLIPMVESLLKNTKINIKDIDIFSVAVGPGSFTGIRIGVCAIKGMAMALNKPCIAVSTLEAMAYNLHQTEDSFICCAVMDARCNQVYNSLFEISCEKIIRLSNDRAISIIDLEKELKNYYFDKNIKLVGDGCDICYNNLDKNFLNLKLLPLHLMYQNAVGVALASLKMINNVVNAEDLVPNYLRPSQAERELKKIKKS